MPAPFAERKEPTIGPPGILAEAERDPADPKWWQSMGGGGETFAGPVVNRNSAMRLSTVFACVRLIAGTIAGMPFHVYKPGKDGDRARADNHPVDWILSAKMNGAMTARVGWEYMLTQELLGGDQFAIIDRPSVYSSDVRGLIPVAASNVTPFRAGGDIRYAVSTDDGRYAVFDQADIFHVPGVGFDGLRGKSVIKYAARESIGTGLASQEYAGRFFSGGAIPDVVIKYPGKVSTEQANLIRDYWIRKHAGITGMRKPAVLSEGGEVEKLTITPEDAMLLDVLKWTSIDIARAFGVPPVMVGETEKTTSWGSGVEEMARWFVIFTLNYHLTKIEQEADTKLIPTARFFAEFTREQLLQGDTKSQADYFARALGSNNGPGWMTVDEVRRVKNLPAQGGDAAKLYRPQPGGGKSPAAPPQSPDPAQPPPQPTFP